MPSIKRRQFLQFTGASLAALGINQWDIQRQSIRYAQVLAQSTPRKLALLVGINRNDDPRWPALFGAENDVRLQKELLVHRFGFKESDVVPLVGAEATRKAILETFNAHLVQQAKPGDVVVFHFSGHGSQVADPGKVLGEQVSTLVSADSRLPGGYPKTGGDVQDITGHTIWLLMRSLDTENATFVLDCCHSGGARKGIVTVRARPGDAELLKIRDLNLRLLASPEEQEYQRQLMAKFGLSNADLATQRKKGVPKGLFLAAASRDQAAIDTTFADIDAGVFTYVLTRYLWQETGREPAKQLIVKTQQATQRLLKQSFPEDEVVQQPELNTLEGSEVGQQAIYFTPQKSAFAAEAVTTGIQNNQVDLFLGGVDPQSLEAFGQGATLTWVDDEGKEQGKVRIDSRQKLTARGTVLQANTRGVIAPGVLLQERTRAIPHNLTLRIGLDSSLDSATEAAKQALQAIKRIEAIPVNRQEVHYILGRMTADYQRALQGQSPIPAVNSVGLFSPGLNLIPDSFGAAGESVTDAVKRLQSKLRSLLAARLIKLTLNTTSSRLSVAASMQVVDQGNAIAAEVFTVRGAVSQPVSGTRGATPPPADARRLKAGTKVQFLVQNHESRDLYVSVLLISTDGEMKVLSPLSDDKDAALVKGGQTIQIPDMNRGDRFNFKIGKTPGTAEVLVVASATPLTKALDALSILAVEQALTNGTPRGLGQEPTEAIAALLTDLDEGTRGSTPAAPDVSQIDTHQMAALSITFEIVPSSSL